MEISFLYTNPFTKGEGGVFSLFPVSLIILLAISLVYGYIKSLILPLFNPGDTKPPHFEVA